MSIPSLSEATIRRYATSKSWQRGEDYYLDGCVTNIIERGHLLTAEVRGNNYEPYRVNVSFKDNELSKFYCSCPYSFEGICKHLVATLLVCIHEPDKIKSRPSIEQILDCLSEIQTQTLIQELVAKKPELIDDIESLAKQIAPPVMVVASNESKPSKDISVNSNSVRSQIRDILESSVSHFEYGGEDDIATEEICSLIQDAKAYSQMGDFDNAVAMLTAITEACVENWDIVDDYGVPYDEVATELNTIWSKTILRIDDILDADRVDLDVSLEFWNNQWLGYFDMAIAALHRGWHYPPLQEVLRGNIVSLWSGEKPKYARDLALLRLQILREQNKLTEYLYLADAAGLVTDYLTMLVSLDRVAEAMRYADSHLKTMEQALAFSQALVHEQNALSEALAIAKRGLNLPGNCQYNMAAWTSKIAEETGDIVTAIKGKVKAFQEEPTFADYRQLEQLAGENWSNIKGEVLAALAKSSGWGVKEAKIDIYLYEGFIEKAIAIVDNLSYYEQSLVHKVMDAAISTHSDWVVKNACDRAESIMVEGKAKYYESAIRWLKKARAAYLKSARKQQWLDYREELMTVHSRKRKFIGLMKSVN